MKKLFQLFIVSGLVSVACNQSSSDKIRSFIPGVYVKEIDHEFAKGMDTIIISVLDMEAGSYIINRKSDYQQTIDGKLLSPKHKTYKWTAVYDKLHNQLYIQQKGRVLSFLPDSNKMLMESAEYRKIRNE